MTQLCLSASTFKANKSIRSLVFIIVVKRSKVFHMVRQSCWLLPLRRVGSLLNVLPHTLIKQDAFITSQMRCLCFFAFLSLLFVLLGIFFLQFWQSYCRIGLSAGGSNLR